MNSMRPTSSAAMDRAGSAGTSRPGDLLARLGDLHFRAGVHRSDRWRRSGRARRGRTLRRPGRPRRRRRRGRRPGHRGAHSGLALKPFTPLRGRRSPVADPGRRRQGQRTGGCRGVDPVGDGRDRHGQGGGEDAEDPAGRRGLEKDNNDLGGGMKGRGDRWTAATKRGCGDDRLQGLRRSRRGVRPMPALVRRWGGTGSGSIAGMGSRTVTRPPSLRTPLACREDERLLGRSVTELQSICSSDDVEPQVSRQDRG